MFLFSNCVLRLGNTQTRIYDFIFFRNVPPRLCSGDFFFFVEECTRKGVKTKKRVHIHKHTLGVLFLLLLSVCMCVYCFEGWFFVLFVDCCGDRGRCCGGGGFGPRIHAAQSSRGNTKNSAQNVKNK